MKYKLINNKTKEETLCDKVTIDGFDYYVGKSDIGIKDYFEVDGQILQCLTAQEEEDLAVSNDYPKVIATTNSKIDISKVVDEVERLAEKIIPNLIRRQYVKIGFIAGYNKSQETHPNTDEDTIEFGIWCLNNVEPDLLRNRWLYCNNDKWGQGHKTKEELLQIWKEQQPKIVYYND